MKYKQKKKKNFTRTEFSTIAQWNNIDKLKWFAIEWNIFCEKKTDITDINRFKCILFQ